MTRYFRWIAAAGLLAGGAVGAAALAPDDFEADVFAELNRFRGDPAGYADVLRAYRPRFEGKLLLGRDRDEIDIMTREGVAAVDEAIRDLRPAKPLGSLERAAADHVAAQSRSGAVGHYTGGRGPGERADRGHRHSLLRAEHRYAGVACGSHKVHRTMCVIMFSPTPDGSPPPPPKRRP